MKDIVIKGASENNLKNIDLKIPRNKFVVITGLSGSGKSSLAFDTIYAEGQRRYVESLSAYARQFLGQMKKPRVELIEGLSPAISIDQKARSNNPRSTVGTITEIYDYLRLLFARIGTPYCPICDSEIEPRTIDDIVLEVLSFKKNSKILVLAPIVRSKKGTFKKELELLKKEGFSRVKIDGKVYSLLDDEIDLKKNIKHDISVIVDRLIIGDNIKSRLTDSLELALSLEENIVVVEVLDDKEYLFNLKFSCPTHGSQIEEMEPRVFSFNSPFGACEECKGLGSIKLFSTDLVIPDKSKSINEGAISTIKNISSSKVYRKLIEALLKPTSFTMDDKIEDFSKEALQRLLYGEHMKFVEPRYKEGRYGKRTIYSKNEGIINSLYRRYKDTNSNMMRHEYEKFMRDKDCEKCRGQRLKPEVLSVRINGKNIFDVTALSIKESLSFFENIVLSDVKKKISEQIIIEIKKRLMFLKQVGLDYLTLSRSANTLSGGEAQRIRLATQIGSGLVGVLYILDEPSIGLHQKDNQKLLDALKELSRLGNTLLVVEHDEETIRQSDHIIDIGPFAGENGGKLVAQGDINKILKVKESLTSQYLRGDKFIEIPKERKKPHSYLEVLGINKNNLKDVDLKLPLGVFNCITGVSGSGKSSLVESVLGNLHNKVYSNSKREAEKIKDIKGYENIDKIIVIDQSPIGRTPRSNPATYTKVFDHIRDLYAQLKESKIRGYKKGRFSFNVKGGRCEACKGDGINKIEMHFLPDIYVNCEICKAKRYNNETLQVKYKGQNIHDVLQMSVDKATEFFENIPQIYKKLITLKDVGLGYIKLGQPSTQLSGGEAQRIKLASELSKRATSKTLYILDEPTTGLHIYDVHMLIKVLNRLVEGGNTLLVIEHNLDIIKSADYIVDLGPDGGDRGGNIIAKGTPEELAKSKESYTAKYLKKILG